MKPGFRAKNGSKFIARIKDLNTCECGYDINVPTWYNFISPNGDNINDVLYLKANNFNTYVIEVFDRCNNSLYKNAGLTNTNNLTPLWNGSGILNACDIQLYNKKHNWYISTLLVIVYFYNNCGRMLSKAYPVSVVFNPNFVSNLDFNPPLYENKIDTLEYTYYNIESNENNIYPNPVKDFLQISLDLNENYSFEIIDIYSRVLTSGVIENLRIDVRYLNGGTYFLKIKSLTKTYIYRFIKI